MPYLGDSPTNPVPLTLSGGEATGEAAAAAEHDRHVCWFSVPTQAAGNSVLLEVSAGGTPSSDLDVVLIWEGSNTAYYVGRDRAGNRQLQAYRPLPAGTPALVGVLPKGALEPAAASRNGQAVVGSGRTLAQWATDIPTDLTKRLPAQTSLSVTVGATVAPPGSAANPAVADFTSSQAPIAVSPGTSPDIVINVTLPAGYGLKVTDGGSDQQFPAIVDPLAATYIDGAALVFAPTGTTLALTMDLSSQRPVGDLSLAPMIISELSGDAVDADQSPEPVNVLLFRTADAYRATQGTLSGYAIVDVPAGDYIAVAFSQNDGRDVRASNVLVPPGERAVGGGYPFVPPMG